MILKLICIALGLFVMVESNNTFVGALMFLLGTAGLVLYATENPKKAR